MAANSPTTTIVLLFFLVFSTFTASSAASRRRPEKTTHIRFYMHDTLSGTNPSAVRVLRSPVTSSSSLLDYGDLFVIDDALTEGPSIDSKLVGRAQGFYIPSSHEDLVLMMNVNIVFTSGEFKGSTVAVLGRNQIMAEVRELAVVGGTGKFRLARGYALDRSYSLSNVTGDGVLQYDLYVVHY